jgi:FAD/FMN-containing dehydrogenase
MIHSSEAGEALRSVLAEGAVSQSPDDIAAFRAASPIVDAGKAPTAIARPSDPDELQRLVRLANEAGLNLTVASSTGDHRRGGLAAERDNVLIDLSRWKKVPWINRRNRVCLIEPGVTYGDLLVALRPHGMTIPMPLSPRNGKSVVASVMDREPSTWPNRQWDAGDPVASTEIIFGNGDLFRTGAAGGPGTLEQQRASGGAQKSPAGPSQTDFHRVVQGSQGTMGIVTWITMRAELRPTVEKPFLLGAESLDRLIPFVYEVQRPWLGEQSFLLDRTAAAMLMSAQGAGAFEAMRDSLPGYFCLQNIAGFERMPRERVRYQEKDIRAIAERHGLSMNTSLGQVSAEDLLKAAVRPCGETDWRHRLRGCCLSVFFLTTLDRAPGLVNVFTELAGGLDGTFVGSYIQPVVQNHACHVELMVPFDPGAPGDVERMRALEKRAVPALAEAGAFFSRPYGPAAGVVFGRNPKSYEILKKVKSIFDPNRVLNSGKWGL